MSPEDEGQQNKSTSTSTSIPVILDLAMNNQNNHNNFYNSNNSYPLNKITSNSAATKAKWLNGINDNSNINTNGINNSDYIDNDRFNIETDENRNDTIKQNGHNHHMNNGSIKILPKTPNGSTSNGKLYYNNNNNNNNSNSNNNKDVISNGKTKNYNDLQTATELPNNHNQLERRDSATNVLSPLLEKENNTSNNDDTTLIDTTNNTKINTLPLHDSLPNINSVVIYDNNKDHRNNNGIISGNCDDIGDSDCWTNDTVQKNNLKNNLHRNNHHNNQHNHHHHNHHQRQHNNNGSLTNGKNALGVDKLLNENDTLTDPILYNSKSKKFNDDEGDVIDACTCSNNKYNNASKINDYDYNSYDDDDSDNKSELLQSSCGIFGCNPKWAKNLASTHMFMVVFLLAWVCIGMFSTYFVSIITTIEKLFQIKSRTTGMLLSASELGQISTALLLTYYAGRGHRPRWIACGMVLFAIAAFACSLPHFIFGSQLMHSNNIFNGDKSNNNNKNDNSNNNLKKSDFNLCLNPIYNTIGDNLTNSIFFNSTNPTINSDDCVEHLKEEQDSHSKITIIVMVIFFFSLLSAGVGQTAVSTLGIPYIDDNVASKESPVYLAITIGVRVLGPTTGFILGSFCTRIFVDLSTPDFSANDPRWISAWWLGPVIIGTIMMLASIAMFSFPKELQNKRTRSNSSDSSNGEINKTTQIVVEEKPKLKDFPKTVKKQLGNSILMFRTASSVFHILPIAGLYTFLPKYLETQFRLAAADANLITAIGGILVMGIGIMISGILILKINPSARSVAGWIAFTALIYSAGFAILMFVGCNINDFSGLSKSTNGYETSTPEFLPDCDVTCDCDLKKFSPICGIDGKTYFSSCHAGCSAIDSNSNQTYYNDCKCIPSGFEKYNFNGTDFEAVGGYCDTNCKNFILFICLFTFCVFMHSTSEVGGMLVIMRCTDPKDKALAMGVTQSAIGLFGTVPCPIIYGAVVDSACLVWTTVCGKDGACSLYNVDNFRHYFLGITSGFMFIAFIMDVIVWSKAHRIDIAPSDAIDASSTETEFEKPINKPDTSV